MFVVPEWLYVSPRCHAILECCFPDQHACATRSSQLGYSFHTGTNLVTAFTWYRYGMWSAFIPERNFRTGTRTGVNSYRYDSYRCGISYRYHVNKYRATSGNRYEPVPEWKSYRYHVNTPSIFTPFSDMEGGVCKDYSGRLLIRICLRNRLWQKVRKKRWCKRARLRKNWKCRPPKSQLWAPGKLARHVPSALFNRWGRQSAARFRRGRFARTRIREPKIIVNHRTMQAHEPKKGSSSFLSMHVPYSTTPTAATEA